IFDTNGNAIKIYTTTDGSGNTTTHYQDEQTLREIKFGFNSATNTTQVQYQTVGGAWAGIDINGGTTHVYGMTYKIGDPCLTEGKVDATIPVIRSIVFPQTEPAGTARLQFSFSYNSDAADTINLQRRLDCSGDTEQITSASHGWGSLSQMITPLGATV